MLKITLKTKYLALTLIVLLLSACASAPKPIDLSRMKSNQISTIKLKAIDKIQIHLKLSTAGSAFGLLGGLVDTVVNKARQKKVEKATFEIRNNMSGFPFSDEIKNRIPEIFNAPVFSNNLRVDIIKGQELPKTGFGLNGYYRLSDNLSYVTVILLSKLYDVDDKATTREYSTVSKIPGTSRNRNKNIKLLKKNDSNQLKSIIISSVHEALSLLNKDFAGGFIYKEDAKKVSFFDGTYPFFGRILAEEGKKVIAAYNVSKVTSIFSVNKDLAKIK